MRVLLLHAFGESPGAVDDEQATVSIGFAENWTADAEPDVACERLRAVVGVGPEDELVVRAQRFDRAFVSVLSAMDDEDCGRMSWQESLSPLFRFVDRGGDVDGDATVAIE